ncbi:MAG: Gfo/Idh/MocA family oxidoreductase, partial [Actinobacteria bacterium]|nr:Gfo/Idh/MocA family oxidoreductase [Actinomycetota bacterium]
MEAIRVGIVGTGFAAASHADALRRLPQVEVAGIAGSSKRKAEEAAGRLGIGRAASSYEDLAADDSIDAIHNCTPNYLHVEINETVLQSGKHLLSEKPLAVTSQETARLVALAETSEVVAGVCFNYRHYPLVSQVKMMLENGHHGRPH